MRMLRSPPLHLRSQQMQRALGQRSRNGVLVGGRTLTLNCFFGISHIWAPFHSNRKLLGGWISGGRCLHLYLTLFTVETAVLVLILKCCINTISCGPGWPLTCYGTEDDPELLTLLPLPSMCWDGSCVPPCLRLFSTGDGKKGLVHARQAFHCLSLIPASYAFNFTPSLPPLMLPVALMCPPPLFTISHNDPSFHCDRITHSCHQGETQ